MHLLERLLDVAESDALGHEGVEIEVALLVVAHKHREVPGWQAVAVPRRLERTTSTEDVEQGQLDRHVGRRHPDEHDGSGEVAGVKGLFVGLGASHGVDHDIRSVAAGESTDRFDRIFVAGVDAVGRSEREGQIDLA